MDDIEKEEGSKMITQALPIMLRRALRIAEKGKPVDKDTADIFAGLALKELESQGAIHKEVARLVLYTQEWMPPEFHHYVADVLGGKAEWLRAKRGPRKNPKELDVVIAVTKYRIANPQLRGLDKDLEFIEETAVRLGVTESFVRERLYMPPKVLQI